MARSRTRSRSRSYKPAGRKGKRGASNNEKEDEEDHDEDDYQDAPWSRKDEEDEDHQTDGAGRREKPMKPGDWICPDCGKMMFARRRFCMDCSTPRPGAKSKGAGKGKDGRKGKGKSEFENSVRRQVGWLNKNGFDDSIAYAKVAEEAEGLSLEDVREIVDSLCDKDKKEHIENPTAWICNAFVKRKRFLEGKEWSHTRKHKASSDHGLDKCVRQQVGWLNAHGFDQSISYEAVAEEAYDLSINDVREVCDRLRAKDKKEHVDNPTGWICNALARRRKQSQDKWAASSDQRGNNRKRNSGVEDELSSKRRSAIDKKCEAIPPWHLDTSPRSK